MINGWNCRKFPKKQQIHQEKVKKRLQYKGVSSIIGVVICDKLYSGNIKHMIMLN